MKAGAIIGVLLAVVMMIVLLPLLGRVAENPYDTTTVVTTTAPTPTHFICLFDTYGVGYFGDSGYMLCMPRENVESGLELAQLVVANSNLILDEYGDPWVINITAYKDDNGVVTVTQPNMAFNFEVLLDYEMIIVEVVE